MFPVRPLFERCIMEDPIGLCEKLEEQLETVDHFWEAPFQQRLMRLNLKPMEDDYLRNWFGCDAIEKAANKEAYWEDVLRNRSLYKKTAKKRWNERKARLKRKEKFVKRFMELKSIEALRKCLKRFQNQEPMVIEQGYLPKEIMAKYDRLNQFDPMKGRPFGSIWRSFKSYGGGSHKFEFDRDKYKTCTVKHDKLEEYTEDIIPDYVLTHLHEARKLGFEKFEIAYPVLESMKQPDPVLVGVINKNTEDERWHGIDRYFISFWE